MATEPPPESRLVSRLEHIQALTNKLLELHRGKPLRGAVRPGELADQITREIGEALKLIKSGRG